MRERYRAAEEFLNVYKRILAGEAVTFSGEYIKVEDARVSFPPVQRPHPPLYFGGSSEAAHDVGSRTIDKYLSWGEPPKDVAAKFADFRARAEKAGREVTLGVRLHLIVRETTQAAWAAAASPDREARRRDDRQGAGRVRAHGFGRTTPHERVAWRDGATSSKSIPISGQASGWCAAARARRWSAIPTRWPSGSTNIAASARTRSSSRAIRIWRRPIASPSCCCRDCRSRARSAPASGLVNTGPFGEILAGSRAAQAISRQAPDHRDRRRRV